MSLLSPDRIFVSLEPHAVAWVLLSGTFKVRVTGKGRSEADAVDGPERWQGALKTFTGLANEWRQKRLRISVVLSNHFVRYALVSPQNSDSFDEALALARFQFVKIHGERAKAWEVRLSPGSRLACAVDAALLAGLKGCLSVQPYLMSAFNRWRRRIPKAGAWLLLQEPERVCVASVGREGWRSVHIAPDGPWTHLIDRERHRAAGADFPRLVLTRPLSRADLLPFDDTPVMGSVPVTEAALIQ